MRTRSWGISIGLVAAGLALRPLGPSQLLSQSLLAPARVVGSFAIPAQLVSAARHPGASGSDAETLLEESALSLRLERAVLRSAWPESVEIGRGIVPVPGETLERAETGRDRLTLRVSDTRDLRVGQPVVAGDAYVGAIDRIPYAERRPDRPERFERMLRRVGLASAPRPAPRDIVEVALITGPGQRVGGLVEAGEDGPRCRLVVGGLVPRHDRIWLAVHNPETRGRRSGSVLVQEPLGLLDGFDSLAEDFLVGELKTEASGSGPDPFAREVRGILPAADFGSGLNQVLVLTRPDEPRPGRTVHDIAPAGVLEEGRWCATRWIVGGDTCAWRSTARIDRGRRAGVAEGAAVVDGVRFVGRVSKVDPFGATVIRVDDPGTSLSLLAQSVAQPDAEPLVVGRVTSLGRSAAGELLLAWRPESSSARERWIAERYAAAPEAADGARDSVPVRLWTGSGMTGVPRGLLLGEARLPVEVASNSAEADEGDGAGTGVQAPSGAILLSVSGTGRISRTALVRLGRSGGPVDGALADGAPADDRRTAAGETR